MQTQNNVLLKRFIKYFKRKRGEAPRCRRAELGVLRWRLDYLTAAGVTVTNVPANWSAMRMGRGLKGKEKTPAKNRTAKPQQRGQ